jgi:hypothetical protein
MMPGATVGSRNFNHPIAHLGEQLRRRREAVTNPLVRAVRRQPNRPGYVFGPLAPAGSRKSRGIFGRSACLASLS